MNKKHIGGGVYVDISSDGHVILTTELVTNKIFLDMDIFEELTRYIDQIKGEVKEP